ncbi:SWF or SNF family helicase [Streptomyces tsukubensis]|uniref:SWF or SNF family helicase n=1 Tax=Streptomyces tsukubensis TaxID=83656 RepID=A0A1V4A1K6_9ACTN|nr:SWF or SNF family helicase [Streptomyces tsukubensis]QFR98184.1 SWF or SNF family helicase [Streptomyces tsukubensis]
MTEARERTFEALPPAQGRGFTTTWWGHAWLKALEDTALDTGQLKAGRKLARGGGVGAVSIRPGRITAVVQDRDGTRHRSDVLLQQLGEEEWDRFLSMAVERAGHIAALLEREMPPHLVEDAAAAGVDLLPGVGDLEPECGCEAWDHCAHTAALSYQVARLLDQDPFVLLLLRGRGERALLDELQQRSATYGAPPDEVPGGPRPEVPGVSAEEAYAASVLLPALPPPPALPPEPGLPPVLDTETPPEPGVEAEALEFLATAAAATAHALLAEALSPGHATRPVPTEPTVEEDAARLASGSVTAVLSARLAAGSGRDGEGLALAVRAWRYGGAAGLAVLEEEWTPSGEAKARARASLEAAWDGGEGPVLRAARNRWSVQGGSAQLRLAPDGRWWPYRKERGRWAPAGPPTSDPAAAMAAAGGDEDGGGED